MGTGRRQRAASRAARGKLADPCDEHPPPHPDLWLWGRNGIVNNLDNEKIKLRSSEVEDREGQ